MATITSHCHWVNPGWPSPSQTIWTLNVGGGGLQIPQSFATTAVNRSWQLHCFGDHMTNPKGKKQGQNAKTWKGRHVRKSINAWSRYFSLRHVALMWLIASVSVHLMTDLCVLFIHSLKVTFPPSIGPRAHTYEGHACCRDSPIWVLCRLGSVFWYAGTTSMKVYVYHMYIRV